MKVSALSKDEVALYEAFMRLKSSEELRRFMADLCTPREIAAFAERWSIARSLYAGQQGYREIAARTGASTTTVARVARFLFRERHHGYRTVLDRVDKSSDPKVESHAAPRPGIRKRAP